MYGARWKLIQLILPESKSKFFSLLYPRIHVVYKGVYRNQRVVGWSVGRSVGAGAILRRELLPQFLTDSHEIWHRCLSWSVDVQDTFFDSGKKCVAMVTAYYGQKMGGNLASRTTSSVFDRFSWNLAQMFVLGCRCTRHIFRQWQKVRCHGNGIWAKNGGKSCVANYFLSFWPILMKFGTDVCLGV